MRPSAILTMLLVLMIASSYLPGSSRWTTPVQKTFDNSDNAAAASYSPYSQPYHASTAASVINSPLAAFTYNPCVMCAVVGDAVFFNGNWSISSNGPIASYTWDFGDGTPLVKTTSPNTSHLYTSGLNSGIWMVTLTVQDSAGQTDTVTQSVVFNIRPDFTFQPQKPMANQLVTFNASNSQVFYPTSFIGFGWAFGDGASGSGKLVVHSYAGPGIYRVLLNVQTDKADAQISKTIIVGGSTIVENIILRSVFGIAFYNSSGRITIQPASLFLNMTVRGTNSTGTIFNINAGRITIGPSPTLMVQRNFTSTFGQAFQSNNGRLTIVAQMIETVWCQPGCLVPNVIFQLFLTGPSRLVSTTNCLPFCTRLFGFLYNSQTKIGLFFIVGRSGGDLNEDGAVDIIDLTMVGSSFGHDNTQTVMSQPETSTSYSIACYEDTNGDGVIDITDIVSVASNFGTNY